MPDLATEMDTSKEVTSITGMELPMKGSGSDKGMLVSDVFLNVPVIGGEEWSVACFAEQQHASDSGFSERMFDSYIRLRASRPRGKTTGFAIYTGNSEDVKSYTETCYGFEVSIKYRTFHLPSYDVKELREDKRPFARVMYAGRLSLGTEDDIALREKYAWELLNTTTEREYDSTQRKFILEFAGRIFWLDDPGMTQEVKEAYKMKTIPLDEYSKQIRREEALMEGESKKALEVAQNFLKMGLPVEQIAQGTGLSIEELGTLRQ
ncbi:MAG: hypothetical protein LBT23_09105 [Synergistaceae bacterium]|jgi:hypothetical protein|nr:hypothetical protein [Synergistaceae bacterium]